MNCQLFDIVGETEQAPLNGGLFQPPEHESPEMLVVLDLTEDGFDFGHPFAGAVQKASRWAAPHCTKYFRCSQKGFQKDNKIVAERW